MGKKKKRLNVANDIHTANTAASSGASCNPVRAHMLISVHPNIKTAG